MSSPHIILFELYCGGHHGQFIRQLVEFWGKSRLSGRLEIAVGPQFIAKHPDVSEAVQRYQSDGVRFRLLHEDLGEGAKLSLLKRDAAHGRVIRQVLEEARPDHCVLMYFDHAQVSLGSDLRYDLHTKLSGIYFRPSFHYRLLGTEAGGLREKLVNVRKEWLLRAALRNPHFENLFCLDHYAVSYIRSIASRVNVVELPDGVDLGWTNQSYAEARKEWGIEPGRKIGLMFGVLDSRKGLFAVLEGCRLLSSPIQRRLALVLAGKVIDSERERAYEEIARLRRETSVQVVFDDEFIPYSKVQSWIGASDFILLTYVRHVGSSNVLIRAAAEEKPVLGPDYGLVAEHIRRRSLGLTVDTTSAEAVAAGITTLVEDSDRIRFDPSSARRFAAENSAEKYAQTLFHHLGACPAEAIGH